MPPPNPEDASPVLSVVVPTYDEAKNIHALVSGVLAAAGDAPAEVIVVDDASPDGTARIVAAMTASDSRVRLMERPAKQGLASAVFAGAAASDAEYICVMDADFSHDPEEIPEMLAKAREGYDVVVGSRYATGAVFVDQVLWRRLSSRGLNLGARLLLGIGTRDVLTGFALCRREALTSMPTHYSSPGFKWLVELLATQRGLRVHEWPIRFQERKAGASKAGLGEVIAFGTLCGRLALWRATHWRG